MTHKNARSILKLIMAKNKINTTKKQNNIPKEIIMLCLLGILVLIFGISTACLFTKRKTHSEERYLALYPTLLETSVREHCAYNSTSTLSKKCELKEYGISKNDDPYVIFSEQEFKIDEGSVTPINEPHLEKMYYWESENGTFSNAMDKEFSQEQNK